MSAAPKFVTEIPAPASGRPGERQELIAALAERPNTWAEIGRTTKDSTASARMGAQGTYLKKLDGRVRTATRTVGNDVILFAQVVTA